LQALQAIMSHLFSPADQRLRRCRSGRFWLDLQGYAISSFSTTHLNQLYL
jgi:hypothetical protein